MGWAYSSMVVLLSSMCEVLGSNLNATHIHKKVISFTQL